MTWANPSKLTLLIFKLYTQSCKKCSPGFSGTTSSSSSSSSANFWSTGSGCFSTSTRAFWFSKSSCCTKAKKLTLLKTTTRYLTSSLVISCLTYSKKKWTSSYTIFTTYQIRSDLTVSTGILSQKFHRCPFLGTLNSTCFGSLMTKSSTIYLNHNCKKLTLNTSSSFKSCNLSSKDRRKLVSATISRWIQRIGSSSIRIQFLWTQKRATNLNKWSSSGMEIKS